MKFIPLPIFKYNSATRHSGITYTLRSSFLVLFNLGRTISFIFLPLLLSGCMGMNEAFECLPGKGVGCVSTMRINEMVNQGELRQEEFTETPPSQTAKAKERVTCTDC